MKSCMMTVLLLLFLKTPFPLLLSLPPPLAHLNTLPLNLASLHLFQRVTAAILLREMLHLIHLHLLVHRGKGKDYSMEVPYSGKFWWELNLVNSAFR